MNEKSAYFFYGAELGNISFSLWKIWEQVNLFLRFHDLYVHYVTKSFTIDKQHSQTFRSARWRCSHALFGNPWSNKSEWWPPEGDNPFKFVVLQPYKVSKLLHPSSGEWIEIEKNKVGVSQVTTHPLKMFENFLLFWLELYRSVSSIEKHTGMLEQQLI